MKGSRVLALWRQRPSLEQLELLLAGLVTVLGTLSYAEFFGGLRWLPAVLGSIVLGFALAILAGRRGWRTLTLVVMTATVFLGYALYVCYGQHTFFGLPTLTAIRDLGSGLASGWARMLTVTVPADVDGDLLITPLALGFAAAYATGFAVLGTRSVTLPAFPPLLLFVSGLLFTAVNPHQRLAATGAFLLGTLLLLLLRSNRIASVDQEGIDERDAQAVGLDLTARRWHSTLGRFAFGLPVVAAATALGVAGATTLSIADGRQRFDPRILRDQQVSLEATLTPLALSFAAAYATSLAVLRTRSVTLPALPPLLLGTSGLLFTAVSPPAQLVVTGAFVLTTLLLLLLRSNRIATVDQEGIDERDAQAVGLDLTARRWHSTLGRFAFGLPVVAAATALGVAGATTLSIADGRQRFDPRTLRDQQVSLEATLTPLVQVKPQLVQAPAADLFTVKVASSGPETTVDRVRTVALDRFDGALWTTSTSFLRAGSRLPVGAQLPGHATRVTLDVDIAGLATAFVPVAGQPVAVSGRDLAFNAANGTLVTTRSVGRPLRYRVTGVARRLDAALATAKPSTAPEDQRYTALPSTPTWIQNLADDFMEAQPSPMARLEDLETYLRNRDYTVGARPGHGYGALWRLLNGVEREQVGHAEQYASVFAVLVRAMGYPARVAVGYLLRPQQEQAGSYVVRTSDAHAWPEVHVDGFGWVPFEPTDAGKAGVPPPRETNDALSVPGAPGPDGNGDPAGVIERLDERPLWKWVAFVAAAPLGLVGLLLVGIVLTKSLRRRRRMSRGAPSVRVVAAWREAVDRLRERAVTVPSSLTAAETVGRARSGVNPAVIEPLADLAPIVTAAVFAPKEPDEPTVRRAWALEAQVRRSIDAGAPLASRVRAVVDPRPLLPRQRIRGPRS